MSAHMNCGHPAYTTFCHNVVRVKSASLKLHLSIITENILYIQTVHKSSYLQVLRCSEQIMFCGVHEVELVNSLLCLEEHSAAVHVFSLLFRNQFGTRLWTEIAIVAALL